MAQPYCPVDEPTRAWLDYRWGWLCREFGLKRLREYPLVLPNDEFFPDPYHGTPEDVEKLLARVAGFMSVDVHSLELNYYEVQKSHYLSNHQGTAGIYRENDTGKFEIWLEVAQFNDLERMIATMAHELGHVLLLGQKRVSHDVEDHEPLTDLITVYMGLGVFTGNSVIREHNWQAGNFSGWSMDKVGYLPMHKLGYAFALYARDREEIPPPWLKHLRLDVRKACSLSLKVLAADPRDADSIVAMPYPSTTQSTDSVSSGDATDMFQPRCCYCNALLSSPTDDEIEEDDSHLVCQTCLHAIDSEAHASEANVTMAIAKGVDRFMRYGLYACVMAFVVMVILMMFLL